MSKEQKVSNQLDEDTYFEVLGILGREISRLTRSCDGYVLRQAVDCIRPYLNAPKLEPSKLPYHVSTDRDSFVTRLESCLRSCRIGDVRGVRRTDLHDLLYHFTQLDSAACSKVEDGVTK